MVCDEVWSNLICSDTDYTFLTLGNGIGSGEMYGAKSIITPAYEKTQKHIKVLIRLALSVLTEQISQHLKLHLCFWLKSTACAAQLLVLLFFTVHDVLCYLYFYHFLTVWCFCCKSSILTGSNKKMGERVRQVYSIFTTSNSGFSVKGLHRVCVCTCIKANHLYCLHCTCVYILTGSWLPRRYHLMMSCLIPPPPLLPPPLNLIQLEASRDFC